MIRLTRNLSKAAKRFTIPTRRSDNLKLFRNAFDGDGRSLKGPLKALLWNASVRLS